MFEGKMVGYRFGGKMAELEFVDMMFEGEEGIDC